jgi:hypothetical protein
LNLEKPKKFMFTTLFVDNDYYVKRSQYKNTLYIYVYKKGFLSFNNVVAVKVVVNE